MKAEINNENKVKFFALYLNLRNSIIRTGFTNRDNVNPNGVDKYDSLLLKPLSSISDEDAIEVGFMSSSNFNKCLESYGSEFNNLLINHFHVDYLRSKGYALPWMGLSVEEMVESGWIKLTEL